MNSRLLEKLKEQHTTIPDILMRLNEEIAVRYKLDFKCIKIYSSAMEGLGSKESDLDIYIILEDECIERVEDRIIRIYTESVAMDIELYGESEFKEFIRRSLLNRGENTSSLKTLNKFYIGECIFGTENGRVYDELIPVNEIRAIAEKHFSDKAVNLQDDSNYMLKLGDYESALFLARDAIVQAIAYINASSGNLNFKRKWICRIFINNRGYRDDLLDKYRELCVYRDINGTNIREAVEDILNLVPEIISAAAFL